MPQYMFVYLGGDYPSSPEQEKEHLTEYHGWLASLGGSVVSPAIPFKDTHTVQADGTAAPGSTTAMSGLTILNLDSMEAAIKVAQSCPFLKINGTLEISEMVEMSSQPH